MFIKKHLFAIGTLSAIFMSFSGASWADTPVNQKDGVLHTAEKLMETSGLQNVSGGTGKINGKVTNTAGAPLSDITISIQPITEETIFGSAFENVATTDKKGRFKITGIAPGKYIIRANPSSDEFYLPNDKFNVTVKSKKVKKVKIALSAAADTNAAYVGSAACLGCHPGQKDWEDTAHAKYVRTNPSPATVVAPFDGKIIFTSDGKVKFKPFVDNNVYKVTLYNLNDESISATYTLARTHGGTAIAGKQRYHVKIGNSHYILPIQYNFRNVDESNPLAAWVSFHPENWYTANNSLITTNVNIPSSTSHSSEQTCEGCHVSGLSITQNAQGEFVSGSKEFNISCENCHGPGERHVSVGGGKATYIVNPKYLATDRANEVCGQCHIRVLNKAGESGANFETEYPGIVNRAEVIPYLPGKVLADYIEEISPDGKATAGYWNDNNTTLGENASENNHSKQHHQQYQDFTKSRHYQSTGHKCYTCHESHGRGKEGTPQLLKESSNNETCTTCHGDHAATVKKDGNVQNKHAKHLYSPSNVGGSLCTGCHMPKTAKSGADNDISSHLFDIIKPSTSKAMADANAATGKTNNPGTVITNSCYGCHSEDTDYGVERWSRWEKEEN